MTYWYTDPYDPANMDDDHLANALCQAAAKAQWWDSRRQQLQREQQLRDRYRRLVTKCYCDTGRPTARKAKAAPPKRRKR